MELHRAAQPVYRSVVAARPPTLTAQLQKCQGFSSRLSHICPERRFSTTRSWLVSPSPPSFAEPKQSTSSSPVSPQSAATRNQPFASPASTFPLSPRERLQNSLGQRGSPSSPGGTNLPPRPSFLKNFGPGSEQSLPKAPWNRTPTTTGVTGTKTTAVDGSGKKADDDSLSIAAMVNDTVDSVLQTWDEREFLKSFAQPQEELRLVPSTGRTIRVSGNVDVARSFFLLDRAVRQNRVKSDVAMQRFHERPGLKRKRLRRDRWRRRFMTGFRATCKRVQELRNQGW